MYGSNLVRLKQWSSFIQYTFQFYCLLISLLLYNFPSRYMTTPILGWEQSGCFVLWAHNSQSKGHMRRGLSQCSESYEVWGDL